MVKENGRSFGSSDVQGLKFLHGPHVWDIPRELIASKPPRSTQVRLVIFSEQRNCECNSWLIVDQELEFYRCDSAVKFPKLEGRDPDSPIPVKFLQSENQQKRSNLVWCGSFSDWNTDCLVFNHIGLQGDDPSKFSLGTGNPGPRVILR